MLMCSTNTGTVRFGRKIIILEEYNGFCQNHFRSYFNLKKNRADYLSLFLDIHFFGFYVILIFGGIQWNNFLAGILEYQNFKLQIFYDSTQYLRGSYVDQYVLVEYNEKIVVKNQRW